MLYGGNLITTDVIIDHFGTINMKSSSILM